MNYKLVMKRASEEKIKPRKINKYNFGEKNKD